MDLSRDRAEAAMYMRSTLGYGTLAGHSLVLQVSLWLKHRRSARGAGVKRQRPPGRLGEPSKVLQLKPRLLMTYDKHIPGIYQFKLEILHNNPLVVETCFVCVDVMSYVSDRSVACVVRCKLSASRLSWLFSSTKPELYICMWYTCLNMTYARHITQKFIKLCIFARMISSICKLAYTEVHNLGKRYIHCNQ